MGGGREARCGRARPGDDPSCDTEPPHPETIEAEKKKGKAPGAQTKRKKKGCGNSAVTSAYNYMVARQVTVSYVARLLRGEGGPRMRSLTLPMKLRCRWQAA